MTDKIKCPMKDVFGYCGLYKISEDGRVYRFYKNGNKRELGGNVNHGYMRVRLSMGNKARWHAVHRLVADAFIPNPKKLPQINHKNGVKLDNRVENLEWCTASENVQHAFNLGLNKNTKEQYELAKAATAKPVVCLETGEEYPSLTDAGKAKGVSFSHIGQCALGKRQTAGGYHWAYADGKKAQRQLRTVKDRCVKTIKAKEREIANYLNGISVRDKEIQNLREQLQKAQDALKAAKEYYVIVRGYGKEQHYISYSTGVEWYWNWDLDHAEPFDTIQDAKDQIRAAKIPHARVMKVRRFTEITSITKREK